MPNFNFDLAMSCTRCSRPLSSLLFLLLLCILSDCCPWTHWGLNSCLCHIRQLLVLFSFPPFTCSVHGRDSWFACSSPVSAISSNYLYYFSSTTPASVSKGFFQYTKTYLLIDWFIDEINWLIDWLIFKQNYFKDSWNIFDFITIIGSITDVLWSEFVTKVTMTEVFRKSSLPFSIALIIIN